jgi:TrkA domain protein
MHLERTVLLAVGVSYAFTTATGQRAAVIVHVSGERHLVVYHPDDPDRVVLTLVLDREESRTVAELLGLPLVTERVPDVVPAVDGMNAVRIPIRADSPYVGRRLGDTRARSRTGGSIVAVQRDGRTITSLDTEFILRQGDVVVVVGNDSSIAGVRELLVSS